MDISMISVTVILVHSFGANAAQAQWEDRFLVGPGDVAPALPICLPQIFPSAWRSSATDGLAIRYIE